MSVGRRSTAVLALGSVVSGLLAYAAFALVTHGLGAADAAPVAVLWTQWMLAAAALTFPLQHWITRNVASGDEGVVRRAAPGVLVVVVIASAVLSGLAWLAREPLFHSDDAWFPVMVGLVTLGSALMGAVRGGLGGRQRFAALACSLVAENALRAALVAVLLLAGVTDPVAHGLCLTAGPLVAVLWPSSLRFGTGVSGTGGADPIPFLTGVAAAQVIGQTVLTGGPVLLALLGGAPADVTAMFAALALFRAPYQVALGAVPQLTVQVAQRGTGGLPRPALVIPVAAAVPALAAVLGAWIGPGLLRLVFGSTVEVGPVAAACLAAGCAVAVLNLALTVVGLALNIPGATAAAWAVAFVVGAVGVAMTSGDDPVTATLTGFLVTEGTALCALALVALVPARRRRDRASRTPPA